MSAMKNPLKKHEQDGMSAKERAFVEGAALKDASTQAEPAEPAKAKRKGGGKTRVPIMLDDYMIPAIDAAAGQKGLSRSAFIRQAAYAAAKGEKA